MKLALLRTIPLALALASFGCAEASAAWDLVGQITERYPGADVQVGFVDGRDHLHISFEGHSEEWEAASVASEEALELFALQVATFAFESYPQRDDLERISIELVVDSSAAGLVVKTFDASFPASRLRAAYGGEPGSEMPPAGPEPPLEER